MEASGGGRPSKSENSRIRNEIVNMYKSFVSEVDPKDVLDLLIQKRVISIERKDEVMSKITRQDRCRALLDQLFFCSHDEAFLVLRQALVENYHWIVERIDESQSAINDVVSGSSLGNHGNVQDMVRRLEQLERRSEMDGHRFLEKQNRLTVKKDQLKRELETAKKDLEQSKCNEVELTRQLDAASRRFMELEEEVAEYRTKTLRLESELYFLQESYDEAMDCERKVKDRLVTLDNRLRLTDGEDDVDGSMKVSTKKETKRTGECPRNLLAPPLPPRRSTSQTELNKHSKESAELQTACFLLKDREIKCSDLQLESRLRSLPQTEIWKGKWKKSTDVCVKKLVSKKRSATDFFSEAQVLHRLRHPSVVQLIGISSLARPLQIVTEHLCQGTLRDHLQEDQGNTVDLPTIVDFARQIAEGMCFVARQNIVHRDLRAGNLLLASTKKLVKIANFELALDLQQDRTKAQVKPKESRFPIRWTAPESLEFGRWTPSSDVWSFGILLYEMLTMGEIPYSGKTNIEVFEMIQANYRLPCPTTGNSLSCPDTLYLTMVWCWDKEADNRPSFQMLQNFFQEFFQVSEEDSVQDTVLARPLLVTSIKGCTAVRGIALLDGWLYVVRFGSTQVELYDARDEFKRSRKSIAITPPGQREKFGLFKRLKSRPKKEHVSSGLQDIAACSRNKRLYLSDWQNMCVHCVDPVRKEVTRSWGVESGEPWGISVTSEGNVVVSCGDSSQLCEYSSEGLLLRTVELKMADEGPWHGLQLSGVGCSWVVCHGGRYVDDGYVCVVNSEGNYVRGYEEINLKGPSHLALLSSNHVLVAESTRNRIILLRPSLRGPAREILNPDQGVVMPVRIHLSEPSGLLIVGLVDGTVLVYQIMHVGMNEASLLSPSRLL